MKVLFHRYTPWQGHIKCSTNLFAEEFIKHGHKVSYMYAIMNPARLTDKRRRATWLQGGAYKNGAFVFTPFSLVPFAKKGIFSKKWAADAMYKYCITPIKSILQKAFGTPDVIWTVPPGSSYLGKIFPKAKLIMQVVDYYPAFLGERIKQIEKRDYERAHHIFVIGHALANYMIDELKIDSKKITVLGQGVHSKLYDIDYAEPEDIKHLPHPRAVWVGVLSKGDPGLFSETAKIIAEAGGSLILIGPGADWSTELAANNKAVHLLGPKMADVVPAYLKHSDVGIMLYDREKQEVYKGQNPLKLYEYAAASLEILSTYHEEYNYLNPPIKIIEHESDIREALHKAFNTTADTRKQIKEFGDRHSWEASYMRAEKIINEIQTDRQTLN